MTSPLPRNSPLRAYLRSEGQTRAELRQALQDGAEEAERLIPKLLGQGNVGGRVKAAQLSLVLREIRSMMSALFGDVGSIVQDGRQDAAEAAARGEDVLLDYMRSNGLGAQANQLLESFVVQARQGFATIKAKAQNAIPLSSQVYRTQALATGMVNRVVTRGLLLGLSAKEIAKSVRSMIDPDVKGGVSYAAMRLARTELNNAFRTAQEARYEGEPWTKGMRWNLSGSHPAPDICNVNADQDIHGLGDGIYPVGERPDSHPNCLCYLTPEQIDEDDFVEGFLAGEYDDYLDSVDGGTAAKEELAEVIPINRASAQSSRDKLSGAKTRQEALDAVPEGLKEDGEYSDNLTKAQSKAIQRYESGLYEKINDSLRSEEPGTERVQGIISELDSAMGISSLTGDISVKRGSASARRFFGDRIDENLEGMEWRDKAFVSTTVNDDIAVGFADSDQEDQVLLNILVPKGTPALQVSDFGIGEGGEAEILLNRGLTFRVITDHGPVEVDGRTLRLLDVEVVR